MKKYLVLSMNIKNIKLNKDDIALALLLIFSFVMCMIALIFSDGQQYTKTQTNIDTNVSHKNWTSDTSWTGW